MQGFKKIVTYVLIAALIVTNFYVGRNAEIVDAASITNQSFLKANGKVLKNNYGKGDTVYLRGTNAGGILDVSDKL